MRQHKIMQKALVWFKNDHVYSDENVVDIDDVALTDVVELLLLLLV